MCRLILATFLGNQRAFKKSILAIPLQFMNINSMKSANTLRLSFRLDCSVFAFIVDETRRSFVLSPALFIVQKAALKGITGCLFHISLLSSSASLTEPTRGVVTRLCFFFFCLARGFFYSALTILCCGRHLCGEKGRDRGEWVGGSRSQTSVLGAKRVGVSSWDSSCGKTTKRRQRRWT
ncbi:hypothetical protein MRX96_001883 [Rhipicephalus microplus]